MAIMSTLKSKNKWKGLLYLQLATKSVINGNRLEISECGDNKSSVCSKQWKAYLSP